MRFTKNILLFVGSLLLTTMSLSSCLGEAEGFAELTNEQRATWVKKAAGEYYGNLYICENGKNEQLLEPADFEIKADSSFVCKEFPVSIFTSYITKEPLNYMMKFAKKQEMTGSIHPFNGAYVEDYSYYFFQDGKSLHFTTKFEDADYDVDINYASTITTKDEQGYDLTCYPIALKNTLSDILTANILIKSITINTIEYPVNQVMVLKGYPKDRYKKEETNK